MRPIDGARLRAWGLAGLGVFVTAAYVAAVVLSLTRDLAADVGAETGLEPVYVISWLAYTVPVTTPRKPQPRSGHGSAITWICATSWTSSVAWSMRPFSHRPSPCGFRSRSREALRCDLGDVVMATPWLWPEEPS